MSIGFGACVHYCNVTSLLLLWQVSLREVLLAASSVHVCVLFSWGGEGSEGEEQKGRRGGGVAVPKKRHICDCINKSAGSEDHIWSTASRDTGHDAAVAALAFTQMHARQKQVVTIECLLLFVTCKSGCNCECCLLGTPCRGCPSGPDTGS